MPRLSISFSGNSSLNTATPTSSVYITDSGESSHLSIYYGKNSSINTATSTSSVYITDSGERRVIAFITGPQGPIGPAGSSTSGSFSNSGYITTGQADLRYYPLASNPSGYIQNSGFLTGFDSGSYVNRNETGQFYPNSNPSGFATTNQLTQTGIILDVKINSLSGHTSDVSGVLQSNINTLDSNLQNTGSTLYALIAGISAPSGFITTGQADSRYYPLNSNPSGYATGDYYDKNEIDNLFLYSNPYFFDELSSDISGYNYMFKDYSSDANPYTGYFSNVKNQQFLTGFITPSGYPTLNGFIKGINTASIHAKISDINSEDVFLFYKLYSYSQTGGKNLIIQSDISNLLLTSDQHLFFSDYISGYQITPTDRLAIEWYANVSNGPGSKPNLYLIYAHSTNAAETLPLNAQVFSTTYYPLTNPQNYSTSGNLEQTGLSLTAQNLSTSGALQAQVNSLSGFTTGMSGFFTSLISPINPTFTYTSGALTLITYSGGNSKIFTYTSGLLTKLDFLKGSTTIRKTFNYTSGVLASITQITL